MTEYESALFLHIVGMVGMFAGIGTSMGVLYFASTAVAVVAGPLLSAPEWRRHSITPAGARAP